MQIKFVAGFAPIAVDPPASQAFYIGNLGLPLAVVEGDHVATDDLDGAKHLGVWPLAAAARSCFGTNAWPEE